MSEDSKLTCCGPGYASPAEAMQARREKLLYTIAIYVGTGIQQPDYLATIDADPESPAVTLRAGHPMFISMMAAPAS